VTQCLYLENRDSNVVLQSTLFSAFQITHINSPYIVGAVFLCLTC